jgi:hypothetical protein
MMRGGALELGHTGRMFVCPRCRHDVDERYYGPCATCREALRASVVGERRDVDATAFEPSMHVTPNAVATNE